jgi:hypothetical protein
MFQPGPKPGRAQAVTVRITRRQIIGIRGHEDGTGHATLRTHPGRGRTLDMATTFAAFEPHRYLLPIVIAWLSANRATLEIIPARVVGLSIRKW